MNSFKSNLFLFADVAFGGFWWSVRVGFGLFSLVGITAA